jgi:hypothetical protein
MKYKIKINKLIIFFLVSLVPIISWIIAIKFFLTKIPNNWSDWFFYVVIVLILLIISFALFLSLTYIIEDINKSVILDISSHSIIIKKGHKENIISKKEIIASYHILTREFSRFRFHFPWFNYFPWFKYALIIIKDRKRFFITNLICDPLEILKFLDPRFKTIYTNVPFLDRMIGSEFLTTQEFNKKIIEFEDEFKDYSEQELEKVINNHDIYTDYARHAANNLLEKIANEKRKE